MLNLEDEHYKKEIAKDFIAMANAEGGKIIIGYDEKNKNVLGVPKEWKEERFQQIISKRSDPPVLFLTQFIYYKSKILAIFTLPESKLKPHSDSERNVWIRRGTIIDKAHPREILNMSYPHLAVKSGKVSKRLRKNQDEKRGRVDFETQAGVFEIPHGITAYRSSKLFGEFLDKAHFPVFLPSFDFYRPAPEFGDTKSVLLLENEDVRIFDNSVKAFRFFLRLLEIVPLRLSPKYVLWDVSRLYWSLRVGENLVYGIGAQQAIQAVKDYGSGIFNGVVQFGFGDIYKSTCLLHVCFEVNEIREKELNVRDIEVRLMLSTIPTNWELVHSLFRSISPLMKLKEAQFQFHPTQPEACTLRKIGYIVWLPKGKPRLPFQPIATIGRESSDKPEYDLSQGVIVKGSVFQNVDYKIDEEDSWMADWYGDIFKQPPIRYFEEIPITITNIVPPWEDLVKNTYSQVSPPRIRQIIFGALGGLVSFLNFHGSWSLFTDKETSRK